MEGFCIFVKPRGPDMVGVLNYYMWTFAANQMVALLVERP